MRKRIRSSAAQKKANASIIEAKWKKHLAEIKEVAKFATLMFDSTQAITAQGEKE